MAWEQVKKFTLKNMGTKAGWCLANVAKAFGVYGVKGALPSAKADMQFNKNKGTLHNISTLPKNVAVPVYLDTASVYEHVMVSDKGVYYSDGKKLTSTKGLKFFGWGEYCNSVRIVKKTTTPATNAPKIGNKVKTSSKRDVFGVQLNLNIINDGQSVWKKTTNGNRAWLYKGTVLRCVVPVSSLKKA